MLATIITIIRIDCVYIQNPKNVIPSLLKTLKTRYPQCPVNTDSDLPGLHAQEQIPELGCTKSDDKK